MRIDATIQARTGSTRLPSKVLKPLLGQPMLARQVERIRQSRLIDRVIIATSESPGDDAIAELAARVGAECFRGSEDDVLGRIAGALRQFDVEINVEFQGDNPFPDALIVDSVIGFFLKHRDDYDYVTNALKTTYPPGLEVSVYPAAVLLEANRLATDPALREHIGPNIYQRSDHFRIRNLEAPPWHRAPDLHLEVDSPEDFEVVRSLFERLYPENPGFSLPEMIRVAGEMDLRELNRGVERRWRVFREEQ